MAHPRRAPIRLIGASVGLMVALYALLLPGWLAVRKPYARLVTAAVSRAAFPVLGLRGSVGIEGASSTSTVYVLPDARTGRWGRVRQRFFEIPDMPLAVACGLGLLFIPWRRRLAVVLGGFLTVAAIHGALLSWSAWKLGGLLAQAQGADPDDLGRRLHLAAEGVARYRDVAPVCALAVIGLWSLLLPGPRDAAPGPKSDAEPSITGG